MYGIFDQIRSRKLTKGEGEQRYGLFLLKVKIPRYMYSEYIH